MFKKISVLVLAFSFCLSANAQTEKRTMAIAASPLSAIFGAADVLFQYNVADFVSLTLPAQFSYNWPIATYLSIAENASKGALKQSSSPIGFKAGLGARFYPSSKGMTNGFYLEPRFSVLYNQFGAEIIGKHKLEFTRIGLSPTLHLGGEWFFESGFLIEFGGFLGYIYNVKSQVDAPTAIKDAPFIASVLGIPKTSSPHDYTFGIDFKLGYSW